jgi:hypothetical protein
VLAKVPESALGSVSASVAKSAMVSANHKSHT